MSLPQRPATPGTRPQRQDGDEARPPLAAAEAQGPPPPRFDSLIAAARRHLLLGAEAPAWEALAQAQALLGDPAPPDDALCVQALGLRLRASADGGRSLDAVAEAQRLDALADAGLRPGTRFEIALALGEVIGRIGLADAALAAFARARACLASMHQPDLDTELTLLTGQMLLRCRQYARAIAEVEPLLDRALPGELRLPLYTLLGSGHYFLADVGGPDIAQHRAASVDFHQRCAAEAAQATAPIWRLRCAINLAIGHALQGQAALARQQHARMPALVDEAFPDDGRQGNERARAELSIWSDYIAVMIDHAEGGGARAIDALPQIIDRADGASPTSVLGMMQQRASELLVALAEQRGDLPRALQAQRRLQQQLQREHDARAALSSRLLGDALGLSKLQWQNRLLQQQGDALQQALAQRHQELMQTLDQLRSEVSIRRAAEAALQQAHDELEQRVHARSAELRDTLVALAQRERQAAMAHVVVGVAHELNTPLVNALLALSALAGSTEDVRTQADAGRLTRGELQRHLARNAEGLALAQGALEKAATLVQRFKELSVDQTPESRQRFRPAELLHQALHHWQGVARARGLALEVQIDPCGIVDSCPGALQRIVDQLVDNALTHAFGPTPPPDARIQLRLGADADQLLLSVEDNGQGIEPAQQAQLFTPFATGARHRGHVGFGLHVAQLLAHHRLGGELKLASGEPGRTCLLLRFPRHAPGALDDGATAQGGDSGAGSAASDR